MNLGNWVKRKAVEKNRYYGVVVGIEDKLHSNRVQIRVDKLHEGVPDEYLPFFRPSQTNNSNSTLEVNIPPIGTNIEVGFEEEDFYNGVYYQGLPNNINTQDSFYEGYPNFRGFKTSSGNIVKWYNNGDLDIISASGGKVSLKGTKFTIQGDLEVSGEIKCKECTANSIALSKHKHSGVQTGSGVSGQPTM